MISEMDKNLTKNEDDIDFKLFFSFLKRNKTIISIFSILFFLFACFYALRTKRIWEGQFEIVLNQNNGRRNSKGIDFSGLAQFTGIDVSSNSSNSQLTEKGILESPSVLMPILNFVNEEKSKLNSKHVDLSFIEWTKDKLFIDFKKKTAILQIFYRDTDKDLIIPVLNKLSNEYKEYSSKRKLDSLQFTKNYLKEQISLYKKNSFESIKKVQEFAIEQDLMALSMGGTNFNPFLNSNTNMQLNLNTQLPTSTERFNFNNNNLITNAGIEYVRVNAANEIKNLDLTINKLNNFSDSDNDGIVQFIGVTFPEIAQSDVFKALQVVQLSLADLNYKYHEIDPELVRTRDREKILINQVKLNTLNHLKALKVIAESKKEAATRPKEILIKYKNLVREASRDEKTLISLENELRAVNLEKSKLEEPWRLITEPTLGKNPVAPSRRKIGLFGLFLGLLSGIIISFLKEKKKGLIFEKSTLAKTLETEILDEVNLENKSLINYPNKIFLEDILKVENFDSIKFIVLGDKDISFFEDVIKNIFKKFTKFKIEKELIKLSNNENIIYLFSESVNYLELLKIKKILHKKSANIIGIITFN
tara:strand:+ start:32334 stop:34103 length:1770 start_codon:yes stop_codon:yes gene_type:complete